jgi:allantoinase
MGAGPRRLLGLDGIGRLSPGQAADLVAFDPDGRFEVVAERLAHRNPITPYAGQTLAGRVHHTWVRGHRVVQDGAVVGDPIGEPVLGRKA